MRKQHNETVTLEPIQGQSQTVTANVMPRVPATMTQQIQAFATTVSKPLTFESLRTPVAVSFTR